MHFGPSHQVPQCSSPRRQQIREVLQAGWAGDCIKSYRDGTTGLAHTAQVHLAAACRLYVCSSQGQAAPMWGHGGSSGSQCCHLPALGPLFSLFHLMYFMVLEKFHVLEAPGI